MRIYRKNSINIKLDEKDELQISCGNTKLENGYGIFSIPAITTCPNSTPICRQLCYAIKAERMYKETRERRARNLQAVKNPLFFAGMSRGIWELLENPTFSRLFRIHEAGDFFNQEYFDTWLMLISKYPEITFLSFTKSQFIICEDLPANFKLYFSIMADTKISLSATKFIMDLPRAYAGITPPDSEGRTITQCPGYCDTCNNCFTNSTDVYFHLH